MRIAAAIILCMVILTGCINEEGDFNIIPQPPAIKVSQLEAKAVKIVREALANENPSIRSHAIEIAASANRRELMPKVLNLLKDEYIRVRFAAAMAIGDMDYSAGEYAVKSLLNDSNPNAKIAAAYALARIGKKEHALQIREALKSDDQTIRANAALLLGKLGDKKYLPALYEMLRDQNSTINSMLQAVEAIAMLGDDKVYKDKLWPLLISKYADDQIIGIRGMAALNTKDSKNAIITMLDKEILEVRLYAAQQLGKIGDKQGQIEVADYFARPEMDFDEETAANVHATMAIGTIGGDSLTKYLPKLLQSQSRNIRLFAAQSTLLLLEAD